MYHYKEEKPETTIASIRDALGKVGIVPSVKKIPSTDKSFTFRLAYPDDSPFLFSGGKGTTPDLALASAYGEFIERIQNFSLFPLQNYYEFDRELSRHGGFYYDPHERVFNSADDFLAGSESESIKHILSFLRSTASKTFDFLLTDNKLIAVPFQKAGQKAITYIPTPLIYYIYGTNGMSAGNTYTEAAVQGLSEIIERYVNRTVILEHITLPRIDDQILKRYLPEQYEFIEYIRRHGRFDIEVLDGSLGKEYPVCAVILFERGSDRYFVKFGAHPKRTIALERCLLELFQFRTLTDFTGLNEFDPSVLKWIYSDPRNLGSIFNNGTGLYPPNFFSAPPSYELNRILYELDFSDTFSCLHYLFDILQNEKKEVLIRDCGFLQFPAIHCIVPGMSEINILSTDTARHYDNQLRARTLLKHIPSLSIRDLSAICETIESEIDSGNRSGTLAGLFRIPLNHESLFSKIDYETFLSLSYFSAGRYRKCLDRLDRYLADSDTGSNGRERIQSYYRCLRMFVALADSGTADAENGAILKRFFEEGLVEKVSGDFSSPSAVLRRFTALPCPDCIRCSENHACSYSVIRGVIKRLKTEYSRYQPAENLLNRIGIEKL